MSDKLLEPLRARPLLADRLESALGDLDTSAEDALDELDRTPAHDSQDALLSLLLVHDLWLSPVERLGGRERLQGHPAVAALKWRLEHEFVAGLDARVEHQMSRIDVASPVDAMRRVAATDLIPPVYDWLRQEASWCELVEFLAFEGGPDAGFDDYVALTQVGLSGGPKVALAANYWDEMGRGTLSDVHTVLHDGLVGATNIRAVPREELTISALERAAIGGVLATNRWLQPEALGAFGLIEMQAGPRCRSIVGALRRLDAPAGAFPFYEEHAIADPRHGKDWLDSVIAPLGVERPEWSERMIRGAVWRSEVNRQFFEDAHRSLVGSEAVAA